MSSPAIDWGARYAQLKDRFGVNWSMNQPL